MRKLLVSFVLVLFFSWLMPLGVFIKPSQEKLACGGQRAICLCSHHVETKDNDDHTKKFVNVPISAQKESSSGGASHDFLTKFFALNHHSLFSALALHDISIPHQIFLKEIEQVPKV